MCRTLLGDSILARAPIIILLLNDPEWECMLELKLHPYACHVHEQDKYHDVVHTYDAVHQYLVLYWLHQS